MMDSAWAARLQAVFELSPTILTVTGLDDGRIVEVNDAFLLATAQLFHANPLPMTIVSMRTYRHLDVNDAAVRHSGYSREEMPG